MLTLPSESAQKTMNRELIEDKADELLAKALGRLIRKHGAIAYFLMKMRPFEPDWTCDTAWTDGKKMGYNPRFIVEGLTTVDYVAFVMYHEALHIMLAHHLRRREKPMHKWNVAADYAINPLVAHGLPPPPNILLDAKFYNMSAEQIYAKLPEEPDDKGQGQGQADPNKDGPAPIPGQIGEVRDMKGDDGKALSDDQQTAEEASHQADVQAAAAVGQLQGTLPAGIEIAIKPFIDPEHSFKEILQAWVDDVTTGDYTWEHPNRRYVAHGIYLPACDGGRSIGRFVVAVDTSGSTIGFVPKFIQAVQDVLLTVEDSGNKSPLTVLYCDTQVHAAEELNYGDTPHPKGGGGTMFSPVFRYIEKKDLIPKGVLYFTDGFCNDFGPTPEYDVAWVLHEPSAPNFDPPFGSVFKWNDIS